MVRSIMLAASLAFAANAETVNVPADYSSIQAAIDAASDGDSIVVSPGTYAERIDTLGKAITLRSVDPSNIQTVMATVIDGTSSGTGGPVIDCSAGEGPETIIDGLTITGGTATGGQFGLQGGGIVAYGSSPTVSRCILLRNKGYWGFQPGPGGMALYDSSSVVSDCWFVGNKASIVGGGVEILGGSPQIVGCTFVANYAIEVGHSIYANDSDAVVVGCSFPKCYVFTVYCESGTISLGDSAFCGAGVEDGYAVYALNGEILDLGGNVFLDDCQNPCDIDIDGTVGGSDLGLMLALWGPTYPNGPGDIDGNGKVDGSDLGLLLACWGGGR